MAASVGLIRFASGRCISCYFPAAAAVGAYLTLSGAEVALISSAESYKVKGGDDMIVDFVPSHATNPTAGTLQLEIDGDSLHSMIDVTAHRATNSGRPKIGVPIRNGESLKVKVIDALTDA